MRSPSKPTPAFWDYGNYDQIRENAERLRYHQMLLEKDLAAEGTLNRQLTEQLAEQLQALDQANIALREAQRRLLSEREEERKYLARELHDEIIQDLLSINYELESLEIDEAQVPQLNDNLANVRKGIRELVDSLRNICRNLRPPTIDNSVWALRCNPLPRIGRPGQVSRFILILILIWEDYPKKRNYPYFGLSRRA
jgi:signal transduction histidine kinase